MARDRKGKSKSVHSLLVTYGETEAEEVVSSLALDPWLSWELSCVFLSLLHSLSATVPAQMLSSACCIPFQDGRDVFCLPGDTR